MGQVPDERYKESKMGTPKIEFLTVSRPNLKFPGYGKNFTIKNNFSPRFFLYEAFL